MCRTSTKSTTREHFIQTKKCLLKVGENEGKSLLCDCKITNENTHLEQLCTVKAHMCLPIVTGSSIISKDCGDFNESEASYLQLRCRRRSSCRKKKTKLYHTSSNWRPVVQDATILDKRQSFRLRPVLRASNVKSLLAVVFILVALLLRVTESCSSKSTPRPRPSSPSNRPNVTFQTYTCPPTYAAWYCLNGAKCFFVKVQDTILYNCECAEGYMGPRCEFKDLDGSYMPARDMVILETASIAGGACIAIILTFLTLGAFYAYTERHKYKIKTMQSNGKEFSCIERNITPQYVYTTDINSSNLLTIEKEIKQQSSFLSVAVVMPNETKNGTCICSLPTISEAVTRQQSCPQEKKF